MTEASESENSWFSWPREPKYRQPLRQPRQLLAAPPIISSNKHNVTSSNRPIIAQRNDQRAARGESAAALASCLGPPRQDRPSRGHARPEVAVQNLRHHTMENVVIGETGQADTDKMAATSTCWNCR